MTKQTTFELKPFQKQVATNIQAGQSVVLQAPTGAGKTIAALYPFITNLFENWGVAQPNNQAFPLTCRYAVPMRVLAQQFFREYSKIAHKVGSTFPATQERIDKVFRHYLSNHPTIAIQTGDQADDPLFESLLTFCTIDQLLASFLAVPYSVGKRRANMNVASMVGSYLIFDEFHLYPLKNPKEPYGSRATTLAMLRLLNKNPPALSPFVMMTATFSTTLLDQLSNLLQATCIRVSDAELVELNKGRQRLFHVYDQPMQAQAILGNHEHATMVVCNTRLHAQAMYLQLKDALKGGSTKLILLHSAFTDQDRKALQETLIDSLGKKHWSSTSGTPKQVDLDIIIVATQVVEVGLDISVEHLHTVVAPANSIVQRAGRCARFANQTGHVHIYPVEPNLSSQPYLPYEQELCEVTLAACANYNGQHVGFPEEQVLIDAVHTEEDTALLDSFIKNEKAICNKIYKGWTHNDRGIIPDLIRDVQQINFLIHPDPNQEMIEKPWHYETFGLFPGSLRGAWEKLSEAVTESASWDEPQHLAWVAEAQDEKQELSERLETVYKWKPVTSFDLAKTALFVALSPNAATYDPELGLVLNDGRLATYQWPLQAYQSLKIQAIKKRYSSIQYCQETLAEHVQGLYDAYRYTELKSMMQWGALRLEQRLGLNPGSIDQALRVAFACHDVGKLNQNWQAWCEGWQQYLVEHAPYGSRYETRKRPFAHTDYHPELAHFQKAYNKTAIARPHHACESVQLSMHFIAAVLGAENEQQEGLVMATMSAIARHHAPQSSSYQKVKLIPHANQAIKEAIEAIQLDHNWTASIDTFQHEITMANEIEGYLLTNPDEHDYLQMLLYFMLVRYLRLCDHRSFIRFR